MKKSLITIGIFTLFIILLSIIQYYNDFTTFPKLLKIISLIICTILSSFFLENKKKKYLSGMSISIIFILISLIVSIINHKYKTTILLYYGMILFSSFLGSFIKEKTKKKKQWQQFSYIYIFLLTS